MPETKADDLEAVRTIVEALSGFDSVEQERIIRWASEKVGLAPPGPPATPVAVSPGVPTGKEAMSPTVGGTDIKSFIAAKNPSTDSQFATAVAYYYRFEAGEAQRKDSITGEDLQEATRLAGRPRFNNPNMTLNNTLKQGLLDRGDRGAFTINTVGENLVAMVLPTDAKWITSTKRKAKPKKKTPTKPKAKPKKKTDA